MNEYRVTLDTLDERWEYHVMADSVDDAEAEGEALARDAGMPYDRMFWTNVEVL